jgi:hypothetical protein
VSHTPGPWKLDPQDALDEHGKPLYEGEYHGIAAGCEYHCNPNDIGFCLSGLMGLDDARLIAAAPELLDALKYCVENIQGIADGTDIPSIAIREAALAAITKATGGAK